MFLKELIDNLDLDLELSVNAEDLEIHSDFMNNPIVESKENEINIYCDNENITRLINFNFKKETITEIFKSEFFVGGTVYSFNGEIISVIN